MGISIDCKMNELNIIDLSEEEWESLYYPSFFNPFDCEKDCLLRENLMKSLDKLTEREAYVLKLRFGFIKYPRTLREIGNLFGVGSVRIRQIEEKALRKLRHPNVISNLY